MAPRFADPLKVECPDCGSESLHSVSSLKAFEAQCPLCQRQLRETGERMIASSEAKSGKELIKMVLKAMLAATDCPPVDISLVDAFSEQETQMMSDWHTRGRKHRQLSLGRSG